MTRLSKIYLAACVSFTLLGCGAATPSGPDSVPTPTQTGLTVLTITKPVAGEDLDGPMTPVEGTFSPATFNGNIWVVVRPQMDFDNVYPQSENASAGAPATKNPSGNWSVRASFGGPPQYYDVIAVTASDANALTQLADAVRNAGKVPYATIAAPPFTLSPPIRITRKPLLTFSDPDSDRTIAAATTMMTIRGKFAQGVNEDIWLIIFAEQAPGIAYPQSPNPPAGLPAAKDAGRFEWTVPVVFGGPPQSYELRVYTANRSASDLLSANLRASAVSGNYGLPESTLPVAAGLSLQSKITITRR